MKRLSAIFTIAVLVLLFHVGHISVCYSADNASDPTIDALADSGSDLIAAAAAPQVAVPDVAESSKALIIRIPIPNREAAIAGAVIILLGAVLAITYVRRRNKSRNNKYGHIKALLNDTERASAMSDAKVAAPVQVANADAKTGEPESSAHIHSTSAADTQTEQSAYGQAENHDTEPTQSTATATATAATMVTEDKPATDAAGATSSDISNSENLTGGGPITLTVEEPANADVSLGTSATPSTATAESPSGLPDETAARNADPKSRVESSAEQSKPTSATAVQVETPSASDRDLIQRLEEFVSAQMHNVDLSVDDIADAMCMSRSTLFRRVKQLYGINPNEYLRQRRLSYAADLLQQNKYTISDICLLVGFNSPSYFSSCFKKQYNVLPKNYRMR